MNTQATPATRRIAIVLANPAISTTTGWPVGFWWSELTHPYRVLREQGYEVDLFSPQGGRCVGDAMSDPEDASGYSAADAVSREFIHDPQLRGLLDNTGKVAEIRVDDYDAILVAGGQSPMFSFEQATDLHDTFVAFHQAGKIAAALCHGSAILAFAKLPDGRYLAEGRQVTGFANAEEDAADQATWSYGLLPQGQHVMPWRIEDRLKGLGADFVQGEPWGPFAVRDGNLITGQQNNSGEATARLIAAALEEAGGRS
ncbi:MAG: type 1 glutamine amidotransferase domain-containing protein [Alphaproteobacteria bacterium CG_4_10_14_0_2_um_filter_63_37]|nr:MAG: type 1 glutamine amidotransferase domain-containing protein [Proteobacteria bacterium CG1_02_64_396]PJA25839.1 MAG: type 1 glutamine amidotransferase domain-containing protein [Alphaproteobacteria bacterium CG_4_10_14_0_2_um_filter_63_37]